MLRHHKPMLQFKHTSKYVKNTSYIEDQTAKQLAAGNNVIVLDPNLITRKVYISTECILYKKNGDVVKVNKNNFSSEVYNLKVNISNPTSIIGLAKVHKEDQNRFSKYEGRRLSLTSALNQLNLSKKDSDFDELLFLKLFLKNYELRDNIDSVSWEFAELFFAFLNNNNDEIQSALKVFWADRYEEVKETFNSFRKDWAEYKAESIFNLNDAYSIFKGFVKQVI